MASPKSLIRRADENGVLLLVIRILLGSLFVYMGIKKIIDPVGFMKQIRLYEMLPTDPPHFLNATAIVLPWLEVLCGIGLFLGVWLRGAAVLIGLMLCVFTPAIFMRAMDIHNTEGTAFTSIAFDCGCGAGKVIIWQKLAENTLLLALAIMATMSRSRRFCLSILFDRRRPTASYCRQCGYGFALDASGTCDACRISQVTASSPQAD